MKRSRKAHATKTAAQKNNRIKHVSPMKHHQSRGRSEIERRKQAGSNTGLYCCVGGKLLPQTGTKGSATVHGIYGAVHNDLKKSMQVSYRYNYTFDTSNGFS